jgi:predicted heme/steroid binding protein
MNRLLSTFLATLTGNSKRQRITLRFTLTGLSMLFLLNINAQNTIGGINLGNLTNYLFFFADGKESANWQGSSRGYVGNVAIDGITATEKTSGYLPFAGTVYTNSNTLSSWDVIIDKNDPGQVVPAQAFSATNQGAIITGLEADLNNAFSQINALPATTGFASVSSTSLNGLNTLNSVVETYVINVTSGLSVSTKIYIRGDAGDVFILRWDSDANPVNGYQGTTKFQSGGAIVPAGELRPSNFINVAGNINSGGGGSNPPAPYPQGPRYNNGTGSLIVNSVNFNGGGFFTGYWLTTGDPVSLRTSSMSNAVFAGGWYSITKKFSLASGSSGVYVAPNPATLGSSLGDFVWKDGNKNGIQDAGEPGYPDVTVELRNCSNTILKTTKTNAEGFYKFPNLAAGCYRVSVVLPTTDSKLSPAIMGLDPSKDSDINPTTLVSGDIYLVKGQQNINVDAGIFQVTIRPELFGIIGNFVWNDNNHNGIQDAGEPGLPNIAIVLQNCTNTVVGNTVSDANGAYSFTNVPFGCYRISIVTPGYEASPKDAGSNAYDASDSDIDPVTFTTSDFFLAQGEINLSLDMGLYPPIPASIGNFLWEDLNQNGVQDYGEPGIAGAIIKLYRCDGALVSSTPTSSTGLYQFTNLPSNMLYYVEFTNLPAGFQFTTQNSSADNIDSDVNFSGRSACTFLSPGENDNSLDAGAFLSTTVPATIGDEVWFDTNGNGIQDQDEPRMPGIFVILSDCNLQQKYAVTTDALGQYVFMNVPPGEYRIKFVNPGSYNGIPVQFTGQNAGFDSNLDSDADWLGITACITVNPGELNFSVDAGFKYLQAQQLMGTTANVMKNGSSTQVDERSAEDETMLKVAKGREIRLFPNPTSHFVTLDLEVLLGHPAQIELFDNLGRKVQHIELIEVITPLHSIELNNLKTGTYLVWVKSPGQQPWVTQLVVSQ